MITLSVILFTIAIVTRVIKHYYGYDFFSVPNVRYIFVLFVGFFIQYIAFYGPFTLDYQQKSSLHIVSLMLVMFATLFNLHLYPVAIIAIGTMMNVTAVMLNGGFMPVDPELARHVFGAHLVNGDLLLNSKGIYLDNPRVVFLGDFLYFQAPFLDAMYRYAFSVGDAFISVGTYLVLIMDKNKNI